MKISDLTVGRVLGPSEWLEVDQGRIDTFAAATNDRQWIHVDPVRAASGPFRTTIAHGYLTLSLLAHFTNELLPVECSMSVNYGLNRVRFPAPVPSASRLRARYLIADVRPLQDGPSTTGVQLVVEATIEREDDDKPVCVAESVFRYYA